ncbi:MAG: hypothetical protein KJ726_01660 [Verrucomicrobia bacterium]|nr:hypothetical protein [Verrucomicrobiota bacterium]MBU1908736.1 hypothetical protein [Verrucomicrobiota bacterium]
MSPQWTDAMLRLTLRGGTVYYLQHRDLSSAEPHYFVVLNLDPLGDDVLVLAMASSKVTSVRNRSRNLPPETLVEISPTEYADFTLQSIVDCNHRFRVTRQELLQKLQAGLAWEKIPLSAEILAKLRRGMLASSLIEEDIKDLLR